mgnify:FL=1
MSCEKEFVLAELIYDFTSIIYTKKAIKVLTKYSNFQTKNNKTKSYFEVKLLEKTFKKLNLNKFHEKKNKLKISNSFVRRRRITDDTPVLIS